MSQVKCGTVHKYNISNAFHDVFFVVPATPPGSISTTETSANSIKVTWLEPSIPYGIITSYNVRYNTSADNVTSFITESQHATLEGLDEYTVYTISVSASTRVGFGPYGQVHERTGQASE